MKRGVPVLVLLACALGPPTPAFTLKVLARAVATANLAGDGGPTPQSFKNLKALLPAWSPGTFAAPSAPGDKIEKLAPVLVRADRLPVVTPAKPYYGLFNIPPGVTLIKGTVGNMELSAGVWRHETVGPSYGRPIYVVDLFHLKW